MTRLEPVQGGRGELEAPRADRMLEGIRAAGLRLTPQRVAIVRELAVDETHPTAQELFHRLRATMPMVSFATVYNTLDALKRTNLCRGLALSPGSGRFDPNLSPHDHLVCDGCGLVRDLKPSVRVPTPTTGGGRGAVRALAGLPRPTGRSARGFELRAVERVFRGLCASCASARTTPSRHRSR